MIEARRRQHSFADGLIAEAVEDLWEPWMRHADKALEDEALLLLIQQELAKRCKKSKTRGRRATPAEVVLRMMLLKHVRDWSFEVLSREVRANLVYREFTRIGGEKVPDDKTMGRLARQLGPEAVEKLHQRVVVIAQENKVASGRKLRLDTTDPHSGGGESDHFALSSLRATARRLHLAAALTATACETVWTRPGGAGGRSGILLRRQ
jgi:IS5 family transposase